MSAAADDPATATRLARQARRGVALLAAGLPLAVGFTVLLDRYGAEEPGQVESVWDVVGGVCAGIGYCAVIGGVVMVGQWWRWRRILRRHPWTRSSVRAGAVWWLIKEGRAIAHLPDFDAEAAYSAGAASWADRDVLLESREVDVAGTPGRRVVVGLDGRSVLMTLRPARLGATNERWRRRLLSPQ